MKTKDSKARIAVGADGSGSTFKRIVEACEGGELNAAVAVHFTFKHGCGAREVAGEFGIPSVIVSKDEEGRTAQLTRLFEQMEPPIDLICLAGYLKHFPTNLCRRFRGRVLNSHPARDMKRFGGHGMYGTHVTRAELAAGITETGSTIHLVTPQVDRGKIILQSSVPVEHDDTPETLLARKLLIERELYVQAIRKVLAERLNR